ncbi:MAG: MFS transporter [Patescibacteria group bacterium]|jgi:MFS family permease
MKKRTKAHNLSSLSILYVLGFFITISSALPAYIQSNFLTEFANLNTLSWFFVIANSLTVLAMLIFPGMVKRLSNFFLTKLMIAFYGLSLLSFAVTAGPLQALLSIILFTIASNLLWINMDILIETFSDNASTGKIRTIYFTFINLGWISSPYLAGQLMGKLDNYPLVYLIAALITIPVLLVFFSQTKRFRDRVPYRQINIKTALKEIWKNKDLRGISVVAFLLQLFYSTAVVYLPIYLHQNLGISWAELGLLFSIMLSPFLIFQIPAGIIADKYLGEKEMLSLGLVILIISSFLFFSTSTVSFWTWAGILFLSRVGAALIEAMRETYFFRIVDAEDIGYISVFRTAVPLGYLIGPILAILTLAFLPVNYIFLMTALVLLSGFYFIYIITDSK